MFRVDLPITVHIKGPFVTQSTTPLDYGVDAPLSRDSEGRFHIPGSLILGKLREAWEELSGLVQGGSRVPSEKEIEELLGTGSDDEKMAFEPHAKKLFFSDLLFHGAMPDSAFRYRIAIDEERGAVQKGALAVIESPFQPNETATFLGKITFLAKDEKYAKRLQTLIQTGLYWIDQVGAFASVGFGQVDCAEAAEPILTKITCSENTTPGAGDGFSMAILPDAPFCISEPHTRENNLFVSREIIPGNVIKGAIFDMLESLGQEAKKNFKELCENFSSIRILHALPSGNCYQRPLSPPLSLVKIGQKLFDMALQEKPCLIDGKAPKFAIDWKDASDVKKAFGWPLLRREIRVRTAIDREHGRSQEEMLFAYEMIVPQGKPWLTRVDASRIGDQGTKAKALSQLASLLQAGILGLGKTKATSRVKIFDNSQVDDALEKNDPRLEEMGKFVITLNSPALLLSPTGLGVTLDEKAGHDELFNAYEKAWQSLCSELELKWFFAAQSLSGGPYQHFRFSANQTRVTYYPWILTEPGSVFVFSLKKENEKLKECVAKWERSGLPIPAPVREFYNIPDDEKEQWRHCPFVPQNGFGEIAVNLTCHMDHEPRDNQLEIVEWEDKA